MPMAFTGLLTVNKDTAKLSATLLSAPQANASTTSNSDANGSAPTAAAAKPPNPPPASSTTCLLPLQVELKSPYNDVIPIDLSYVDQGVYRAKYVPPYMGAFELNVKLCGEHLRGSPFTVHVEKRVKAFLTNEQLLRHSIGASANAFASGPLSGDAVSRPFLGLAALGNAGTGGAASVRSGNKGNAIALSVSALHVPIGANRNSKLESGARGGISASGTRLQMREASGSSRADSFTRARECGARNARSKSRPSNTASGGTRSHSQTRPIGLGKGSLALTLPQTEYASSSIARRSPTNPNLTTLSSTIRSAAGGGANGDYTMRAAMSSSMTGSQLLAVPSGRYGQSVCNGVLRIGSRGKGPGEFLSPQGIAVCVGPADGSGGSGVASMASGPGSSVGGRILVTDAQNANVQVFAHDTHYVGQFGTRGKLSGQLQRPVGVCELPDGRVVVVDLENKWINVYDEHGRCAPISDALFTLLFESLAVAHTSMFLKSRLQLSLFKSLTKKNYTRIYSTYENQRSAE